MNMNRNENEIKKCRSHDQQIYEHKSRSSDRVFHSKVPLYAIDSEVPKVSEGRSSLLRVLQEWKT